MNQKDKFKKFSKDSTKSNSKNKREDVIAKIIDKYDVSAMEAEKILDIIEKKLETTRKHDEKRNSQRASTSENQISIEKHENPDISKNYFDKNNFIKSKNNIKKGKINNQKPKSKDMKQKNINSNPENINSNKLDFRDNTKFNKKTDVKVLNNDYNATFNEKNSKDVDSILGDIIPDYKQQLSIKVEHVYLTFEVQNEKIDTLKEAFIRTIKRNKSDKIKIHALKDVSFKIYKGEKVGIIGYNGAGKSTLLNIITGIFPPDEGNVTTYGNISPLLSLGAGFDHNFSGRKNIMLNGAVLGYDKKFLESKIDEIIEFSELGQFIDIPIKNYSSGMLAKLGFSIATAVNPDILIIDEILGVGDVNFARKSADKIKSLMNGGTTVVLVSHSIPQIRELCDKVIWIDNGSVKAIGEVNTVCDEYLKDAEKASKEQLANIRLGS